MRFRLSRWLLAPLLAAVVLPAAAAPKQIILVRHAEKAYEPASNPGLSKAGRARAKTLATLLAPDRVGAIVSSPLQRTRATAEPLARQRGLDVQTVAIDGTLAEHVQNLTLLLRAQSADTVLVVGHSNTVPAIIRALGGPFMPDLCETSFGHLFRIYLDGGRVEVVRQHYGALDPLPTTDCL